MQLSLWGEGTGYRVSGTANHAPGTRHAVRGTTGPAVLEHRLIRLGLPAFPRFETHRNHQVMLSWTPGKRFRVHEGYAQAPDDVLAAIVRFVRPGTPRTSRLAARRIFLAFPAEVHAPAPARPAREPVRRPGDDRVLSRLRALHDELNRLHFDGALPPIPLLLSSRMRRRLGEVRLDRRTGRAVSIAISRRHIRRDGWAEARATLLHEMIHQWQAETGRVVDHGVEFRRKAKHLGIEPSAVSSLESHG